MPIGGEHAAPQALFQSMMQQLMTVQLTVTAKQRDAQEARSFRETNLNLGNYAQIFQE
jgi:hypothetical protein